ncbi:MAG: hypothetical protein E7505_11175 [Ruminococcus sp.]|nr:hypothetical protein [Ruminococcus sp.]
MKKTIIYILFVVILVSALVACSENTAFDPNSTEVSRDTSYESIITVDPVNDETNEPKYDINGNLITSHNGKPDPILTEKASFWDGQKALKFVASNGYEISYRLYVPIDYSEEYAYPVLTCLHGLGDGGTDNRAQIDNIVTDIGFNKSYSPLSQAIIIMPQSPDDNWVDYGPIGYSVDEVMISGSIEGIIELIDCINATYSTNLNRQYIMGSSAGGFGTWYVISKYPEKFTAAAPCCGGGDPNYSAILKDIYIHVYHDSTDDVIPVIASRRMVYAIKGAGGEKIEYTETNGYAHNPLVGLGIAGKLDVFEWLFSKTKVQ